jgi:hypothetical protein
VLRTGENYTDDGSDGPKIVHLGQYLSNGSAFFSRRVYTNRCADRLPTGSKQLHSSTTVDVPNNHFARSTRLSSTHTIVSCEAHQSCTASSLRVDQGAFGRGQFRWIPGIRTFSQPSSRSRPVRVSAFPHTSLICCYSLILVVPFPVTTKPGISCIGLIRSGCARYIRSDTAKKISHRHSSNYAIYRRLFYTVPLSIVVVLLCVLIVKYYIHSRTLPACPKVAPA